MLRSDADAPKPPTYPFISINVKERGHKNNRSANLLAHPAALPPVVVATIFAVAFFRIRTAFPQSFRFGEGASTSGRPAPQEKKCAA
jgi:hypothetical protein